MLLPRGQAAVQEGVVGGGIGGHLVDDHLLVGGVESSHVPSPGYGRQDVVIEVGGDKGGVCPHQLWEEEGGAPTEDALKKMKGVCTGLGGIKKGNNSW